jgi:hypothetical protein
MMDPQKLTGFNQLFDAFQGLNDVIAETQRLTRVLWLARKLEGLDDVRGIVATVNAQKALLISLRTKRLMDTLENVGEAGDQLTLLSDLIRSLGNLSSLRTRLATLADFERQVYAERNLDEIYGQLGDLNELDAQLDTLSKLKPCIQKINGILSDS